MKILMTNDDGQHSPVLMSLQKELIGQGNEVIILVPDEEKSTTSHSLTMKRSLKMVKVQENFFTLDGYPADCALFGALYFTPDLVVSGINKGGNLGQDTFYSGTVGAAREGLLRGIPSLAVSLTTEFLPKGTIITENLFEKAVHFISIFLSQMDPKFWQPDFLFNINIPLNPNGKVNLTHRGRRIYGGKYQIIEGEKGREVNHLLGQYEGFKKYDGMSDCEVIDRNEISITPLGLQDQIPYPYEKEFRQFLNHLST